MAWRRSPENSSLSKIGSEIGMTATALNRNNRNDPLLNNPPSAGLEDLCWK